MSKLEDANLNRNSKITSIANLNPTFCYENEKISSAVDKILTTKHRRLPITSKKKILVGIITITDILDAFLREEDFSKKLSNIMIREPIFCYEDDTIGFVLQKFKLSRRGGFPIVDRKMKLLGMVSERDYVWRFSNVKFGVKVEEVMSKKPIVVSPHISIFDCLRTMVNVRYRRLPVVEKGKLVGIVTSVDTLSYLKNNKFERESLDEELNLIYKTEVFTIDKNEEISTAIKIMKERDVGGLLVVDDSELKGILTERDILERIE